MHVAVIRYNPVIKKQSYAGRFNVIVNSVWLSFSKSQLLQMIDHFNLKLYEQES